ncbi:hypothetical protein BH10ACT3_BH10ACT3_05910 [soil metagenome]
MVDPARLVPYTVNHYFQPVYWSRAEPVGITYVLNERDRPVRPEMQEIMIGHLPGPVHVRRMDGGHLPAVTAPEAFATILTSLPHR